MRQMVTLHPQLRSRESWILVLSALSPFCSVQDPLLMFRVLLLSTGAYTVLDVRSEVLPSNKKGDEYSHVTCIRKLIPTMLRERSHTITFCMVPCARHSGQMVQDRASIQASGLAVSSLTVSRGHTYLLSTL